MTGKQTTTAYLISLEKVLDEITEHTPTYGIPSLSSLPASDAIYIRALKHNINRAKDWAGIKNDYLYSVYHALKIVLSKSKLPLHQIEILSALKTTGRSLLSIHLIMEQPN